MNARSAPISCFVFWVLSGCAVAPINLCLDTRLPENALLQHGCRSETLPYLAEGATSQAQIASVFKERVHGHEVVTKYSYFLRIPEGKIVELEGFIHGPNRDLTSQVFWRLQVDGGTAGGTSGFDQSILYSTSIERIEDKYCFIYQMKPPFVGQLQDCGGFEAAGAISYAEGVTSWRDAMSLAVERVANDSGWSQSFLQGKSLIRIEGNRLSRDSNGVLSYVVGLQRVLRQRPELRAIGGGIPFDSDFFVYRVDAMSGALTLLEHSETRPILRNFK